jgi:hypothetical protein
MSFEFSTQADFVKELQSIAEGIGYATYGITPATPTFVGVGRNPSITLRGIPDIEDVFKLGTEDRTDVVKVGESALLTYKTNIVDSVHAKWGINAIGGGAGSIDQSRTFYYSKKVAGVEKNRYLRGCLPLSTKITVPHRGLLEVEQNIFVQNVGIESEANITGQTPSTPSTSAPWDHSSGGSNSLLHNSTVYPHRAFSVEVRRDLSMLDSSGDLKVLYAKPSQRIISFNMDVFKKDLLLSADAMAVTKRALSRVLKTSVSTITLGDVNFTDDPEDHEKNTSDPMMQKLSGTATTASLT